MSLDTIIPNTQEIDKFLEKLYFPLYFSKAVINHIKNFFRAILTKGFTGKIEDIAFISNKHRTTIGHFISHGVWDEKRIDVKIKSQSLNFILKTSQSINEPIFFIHDDTICKKSKPSSQANAPIQNSDYHFSHLEGKTVWGHQLLSTMIQCNGCTLTYDIQPYERGGKSKIDLVCDLASSLPPPPHKGYALFDSWFSCSKIINTYASKGYHSIGAIKTNRIIYPGGMRIKIKDFIEYIEITDVDLVTVNGSNYYVYRYEGAVNGVENTIVLLSWPEESFGDSKTLKAFLCTDVSLDSPTILVYYSKRWPIETFFQEQKQKLGLDKYQVRSFKGIKRMWLLQSLVHLFCTLGLGKPRKFTDGYHYMRNKEQKSNITWIYDLAKNSVPLEDIFQYLNIA